MDEQTFQKLPENIKYLLTHHLCGYCRKPYNPRESEYWAFCSHDCYLADTHDCPDCHPELEPRYRVGDRVRFRLGSYPEDVAEIVAGPDRSASPAETDWYYLLSNQHAEGFVVGEREILGKVEVG